MVRTTIFPSRASRSAAGRVPGLEHQVAKLKAEPHDYGLLAELNTQPRTSYLAKIKNPNPELEGS